MFQIDPGVLAAAVHSSPDALITLDVEGRVTSWNPAAQRLYGYSYSDIVGRPFSTLGDAGWTVVGAGEVVPFTARITQLSRSGQVVHAELTASPLIDEATQRMGTMIVGRRVSASHRLQAGVAAAEQRQRLLLASLPGTIVALYDRELRCMLLDGPMVRQAGIDPANYIGRSIEHTLAPEQYATLVGPIRDALSGLRSAFEWTSTLSGITYELEIAPYVLADGTIEGAFAVGRDITGRRERERLLADAQASLQVGSWEVDLHEGRLNWSDELCRITGQPLGIRPTVAEFIAMVHPDDRQILSSEIDAITSSGADGSSEYRVVRPDGEIRHVHTTRLARTDIDGNVTALRGITQDITERVQREFEVRRLASVVEHSTEAITTRGADGMINAWNHGAEQLYGYTAEEAIGQPITLIMPADREGEADEFLACALAGGTVVQRETVRRRKDGSRVEVSISVSPLRDHQGKPVGASIIARDISERVAREHEVQRLASIVEHSAEAITASDVDGVITEWNTGAERLYGYTAHEAIGQPITMITPADRAQEGTELRERALAGETVVAFQTVRSHKDGTAVDVSLTVSAVRDHHGAPCGVSVIARDVTAQHRAELARERALHDLGEAQATARIGSWTWEAATNVAQWSDEMYRLFGRDLGIGPAGSEEFFSYVHPADRAAVRNAYANTLSGTAEAFDVHYRIRGGDGVERVVHGCARRERPGLYSGTVQDVTALNAAERDARAAERRFRSTIESAPIGMALLAPDGGWLEVNHALCEIVGYSREELLTQTFQELTYPDDLNKDAKLIKQLLVGEIPGYQVQKRYFRRGGSIVWTQLSVSLMRDEEGHPIHFIIQVQDITSQRDAHEALVASERRFQSIAANVPGMVYRFAIAPDGRFSLPFVSAGVGRVFGATPEQLAADPGLILASLHPDDRAGFEQSIAESARRLDGWEWHGRHIAADGSIKHLHGISQPIRERDGTIVWDGVIFDETDVREAQAKEAEVQQRLQTIMENLVGSAVTLYDADYRLRFCEGPLFSSLDLDSMYGKELSTFVTPATYEILTTLIDEAINGRSGSSMIDGYRGDRSLAIQAAPYRASSGEIQGALVHWHEITAVKQAERERDEALELFQIAFDRAPAGMAIVSLDGHFLRVNDALCEITGYDASDIVSRGPFAIVQPEDLELVDDVFERLGEESDSITIEHRIAHAAGHSSWVQARITLVRDDTGRPVHALAQILDINDRRAHEKRLQHEADHDPLTHLLNRRGFETMLESHLEHCRQSGAAGALLVVDLDGFKAVNDHLGHAAGDELIVACARTLEARLRDTDAVARVGGDEFAVLLPTQTQAEAEVVAQALVDAIRERALQHLSGIHPARVTTSVGIAMLSDDSLTSTEILAKADRTMYAAKDAGKDRYAI